MLKNIQPKPPASNFPRIINPKSLIKNNIPEALGIIISLAGLAVMAGWFLDITLLKSILASWVSMKFSTAFAFSLSGIMLYFIARFQKQERELALIFLPIISMTILLLMASLLASTIVGIPIGVEEFFVKDSMVAVRSVTPGRPSVATMINFVLIAITGITVPFGFRKIFKILTILAVVVGLSGLSAVFGCVFNQPVFYFALAGKSSAMTCHTAVLFVLWGWGVMLTGNNK